MMTTDPRKDIYMTHERPPTWLRFVSVAVGLTVVAGLALVAISAISAALAPAAGAQVVVTPQDGTAGNAGILGPAIVIGLAIAFVKKVVDFPAYVRSKDWNGVTKQVIAWIAGIVVAFVLRATDFSEDIQLSGVVLADTNGATVVLFGLAIASTAAVGSDILSAVDNTRSSAVPPIIDPPAPPPAG